MGSFRPRSIIEILQTLWRRKLLVVLVAAVFAVAAFLVIVNVPRLYESRALIVVSGAIYDRNANGAQIATVTEQMTSRSNLESLVDRYQLYPETKRIDLRVQNLQTDIKFETKYRSDSQGFPESFSIAYRHTDPSTAQHIVSELVSIFDQANSVLEKQATEEVQRVKTEVSSIESKLARASGEKAASAARSSAAGRAAATFDRLRSERSAIASSVEQLRDRQYMLEQQISQQRRLISQQEELVKTSAPPPDEARASSIGSLLRRKAELEAQIQDYSSKFTDKYAKLVVARQQLAEVDRQIALAGTTGEQSRAAALSPAAQELRNLERELSRMQTELEVVQRELSRKLQAAAMLPGGAVSAVELPASPTVASGPSVPTSSGDTGKDYSADALRERYTSLLRREEALREFAPSTAGPGAAFFQTVDSPSLPQAPAAPYRTRLMMIALGMALVAGLIAAVIAELPRLTRLYDDRDVAFYLGVPVLASIPETLTVIERGHARRRVLVRVLVCLVIGAAAVPLLAFALNASRLFQIIGYKQ